MDGSLVLTAGALSSAALQLIKLAYRWLAKNPEFDFPFAFYAIMLPVLNAVAPFALVFLGFPSNDPVLSMTWQGVLTYVLRIAIGAVVSLVGYDGVKGLFAYKRVQEAK